MVHGKKERKRIIIIMIIIESYGKVEISDNDRDITFDIVIGHH
jgi:hypothetical protein